MSDDKKLPNLNLTPEQVADILKDIKPESLLPNKDKQPKRPYYRCDHCHDTGYVQVYGPGPNLPCPACGPRY
jgi:hypothetical protein